MSDYDDDFAMDDSWEVEDGTPESPVENITDSTNDSISAVADLLMGDSSKADAIADKGGPANHKTVGTSVDVDQHGRRDFGGDDKQEAPQQTSQTIYSREVQEGLQLAQQVWDGAHKENERLNDLLQSGQLSAADHQRLTFEQGVKAAHAKEAMYRGTIQELMHGNQLAENRRQLETLGDDWATPEKQMETIQSIRNFIKERGLNEEILHGVETVEEASFLYTAMKNEQDLQNAKLELRAARQMLKKQNAQLKGRQHTAQKSSQLGTKHGTDTQINQVMDVLAQSGAFGGGKKR